MQLSVATIIALIFAMPSLLSPAMVGYLPAYAQSVRTSRPAYAQDVGMSTLLEEDDNRNALEEEDDENVSNFNIAAVGDWGCDSETEDTVDNIVSRDPELVLGLGDNSYRDSADCWFETVDPIIDKMITAIGSHESEVPGLPDEYMNRFGLSEQYYTHRIGNVFVLVMSPYVPDDEGSDQYKFVEESLKSASSDSSIDWIIVAMHEQMYGSPTNQVRHEELDLRDAYHPLFQKYGVDLVLYGHNHYYERTYPLNYYSNEENDDNGSDGPFITTREETNYLNPDGQIFITVGTGGHGIFEFTDRKPYAVSQFDEGFGFLDIEIKNAQDTTN
ncbi:MAG TPA: metallophosphoesterase, partial [Nitrososphaera sp.]|nr:metallophosphoesterase [Nitrososphaera sp.]